MEKINDTCLVHLFLMPVWRRYDSSTATFLWPFTAEGLHRAVANLPRGGTLRKKTAPRDPRRCASTRSAAKLVCVYILKRIENSYIFLDKWALFALVKLVLPHLVQFSKQQNYSTTAFPIVSLTKIVFARKPLRRHARNKSLGLTCAGLSHLLLHVR